MNIIQTPGNHSTIQSHHLPECARSTVFNPEVKCEVYALSCFCPSPAVYGVDEMSEFSRRLAGADGAPARSSSRRGEVSVAPRHPNSTGPADLALTPAPSFFQEEMVAADQEFGAIAWSLIAYLGLGTGIIAWALS